MTCEKLSQIHFYWISLILVFLGFEVKGQSNQQIEKGGIIYQNELSSKALMVDWVMEGSAETSFKDGWMHLYSPQEESHHVFWCPRDFPDSIIIEWEAQNLNPTAGLCIVFFAAKGTKGEDLFDPELPPRDGTFSQYTKGPLQSYHISYYANTPDKSDRGDSHLRKNNEFRLVYTGEEGIPTSSVDIHRMQIIKCGDLIQMYVDDRKIIDWTDSEENDSRPYYSGGKIGLRQMKWTHFRYRNFNVYKIKG